MIKSPLEELDKFKSLKQTGSKLYFKINNLAVLNDEETVIGVTEDSGETQFLYLLVKWEIYLNKKNVLLYQNWKTK